MTIVIAKKQGFFGEIKVAFKRNGVDASIG
jgi:hypothetical protein